MARWWRLAAGLVLHAAAAAQVVAYVAPAGRGALPDNAWNPAMAPTLRLTSANGKYPGKVWVRETDGGIALRGEVATARPPVAEAHFWAQYPADTSSRAYVGVWLAAAAAVTMPAIGWGNQFGARTCAQASASLGSDQGATACAAWEAVQRQYRAQLRRVFVRRWRLTNVWQRETYASRAYRGMLRFANMFRQTPLLPLNPGPRAQWGGDLAFRDSYAAAPPTDRRTTEQFFVYIPWRAMPPTDQEALSTLWLEVDFCMQDGDCSHTARNAKPGEPQSWNTLTLAHPLPAEVTPCGYGLAREDFWQQPGAGWYFPAADGDVDATFALFNATEGYQYDPDSLSPTPDWVHYFSEPAGRDGHVCGPDLRFTAGGRTFTDPDTISAKTIALKRMPDGRLLLKAGPDVTTMNPLGSGQCGACPVATVAIYSLDPVLGITKIFSGSVMQQVDLDGDIQISPDWQKVTVYVEGRELGTGPNGFERVKGWESHRYCLGTKEYVPCGSGTSPPSGPRQVRGVFFNR